MSWAAYGWSGLALCLAFAPGFHVHAHDGGNDPTYYKDVEPLVRKYCIACHHPGEVAPFSLLKFEDVKKRARQIADVTSAKVMPPWKAIRGYGKFIDGQQPLAEYEIDVFQRWAKGGAAEGANPSSAPSIAAESAAAQSWDLGTPDLIVTMPQTYTIPADGGDIYQCFVVPLNLSEDKYIAGIEYRPGNRKVVHHALFSKDASGEAIRKDQADPAVGFRTLDAGTGLRVGYDGVIGLWTPGLVPRRLPDDVGVKLEKDSVLVIQNHYHPTGKIESDKSTLALYFTKAPPRQLAHYKTLYKFNFTIPPGEKHYLITNSEVQNEPCGVLAIMPHMHFLGDEMRVSLKNPKGETNPMVWVKDWEFKWQTQYFYAKPLGIAENSVIKIDAWFDNSQGNPKNPNNPPVLVREGRNSTDEMASIVLLVVEEERAHWSRYAALLAMGLVVSGGLFARHRSRSS